MLKAAAKGLPKPIQRPRRQLRTRSLAALLLLAWYASTSSAPSNAFKPARAAARRWKPLTYAGSHAMASFASRSARALPAALVAATNASRADVRCVGYAWTRSDLYWGRRLQGSEGEGGTGRVSKGNLCYVLGVLCDKMTSAEIEELVDEAVRAGGMNDDALGFTQFMNIMKITASTGTDRTAELQRMVSSRANLALN